MNPLYWLPLPFAATVVAVVVISWRTRARRPADIFAAQESYARFRDAMERRGGRG